MTSSTNNLPPSPAPCQPSATSDAQPADNKIFIGGLRREINENNICDHFSQFSKLNQVLIMKHRDSLYKNVNFLNKDFLFYDKPRGFGCITFEDSHVVTAVLEKEHIIKGRTLCVRRAIPKEKMVKQQQDFENDQYHSDNTNHRNISQSSSRQTDAIYHSRQ